MARTALSYFFEVASLMTGAEISPKAIFLDVWSCGVDDRSHLF
jgi:hypothetical protein